MQCMLAPLTRETTQTCWIETLCLALSPSKKCAVFPTSHPVSRGAAHLENYVVFMSSILVAQIPAQLGNYDGIFSRPASQNLPSFCQQTPTPWCQLPRKIVQFFQESLLQPIFSSPKKLHSFLPTPLLPTLLASKHCADLPSIQARSCG